MRVFCQKEIKSLKSSFSFKTKSLNHRKLKQNLKKLAMLLVELRNFFEESNDGKLKKTSKA